VEVIATYKEARFSGWRSFELLPDARPRPRGVPAERAVRHTHPASRAAGRAGPGVGAATGFLLGFYTVAVAALATVVYGLVRGPEALWSPVGVWVAGVAAVGVVAIA
jgi:hypothetical protein